MTTGTSRRGDQPGQTGRRGKRFERLTIRFSIVPIARMFTQFRKTPDPWLVSPRQCPDGMTAAHLGSVTPTPLNEVIESAVVQETFDPDHP
ncbi:MAG: hypothetical protein L0Y50_07175 [Beijerinckiaceae bacterium]|nr:hypothetical protein [Beijerinckiaceae bacterium]